MSNVNVESIIEVLRQCDAFRWGTVLQAVRSCVRFPMEALEFFIDIILPATLCHRVRRCLKQKWVPGVSSGVKGGRCVGLTTFPPSCADCLEILEACYDVVLCLQSFRRKNKE